MKGQTSSGTLDDATVTELKMIAADNIAARCKERPAFVELATAFKGVSVQVKTAPIAVQGAKVDPANRKIVVTLAPPSQKANAKVNPGEIPPLLLAAAKGLANANVDVSAVTANQLTIEDETKILDALNPGP